MSHLTLFLTNAPAFTSECYTRTPAKEIRRIALMKKSRDQPKHYLSGKLTKIEQWHRRFWRSTQMVKHGCRAFALAKDERAQIVGRRIAEAGRLTQAVNVRKNDTGKGRQRGGGEGACQRLVESSRGGLLHQENVSRQLWWDWDLGLGILGPWVGGGKYFSWLQTQNSLADVKSRNSEKSDFFVKMYK